MKTFNFDEKKAQRAIELLLESFGEDLNREGIQRTPARVAKFYKEALSGNAVDPLKLISAHYTIEDHEEIILVKDVSFYSLCEHHLLPFLGKTHVAYIPQKDKIIGVSKLVRLVEVFANRLQLQERLTKQVADTVMQSIEPHGVMVVVEAEHLCMTMCGVKKPGSKMITSAMRGIFLKDARTRAEVMFLLKGL
ncbi:GTP cyclohydrolase 1 [Endomicrobiia bacterium]|nr:GTP cyclohydrolase 1 [Endomicrobiia bacterium]GHT64492.1 GTP cyclohydrolase 1 [Endomicrobiia bacterium]GHT69156.1 GTP cyclohydrolase 1 [Endomicrobiia bacterium]GHT73165.1 GTP cyclohydrolase 1 [Endomicrobiia bacterium]